MAYQGIKNTTPFVAEPLLLADEEGRDLLVMMAKATYAIDAQGKVSLAETQTPLCLAGEYYGDPVKTSPKYAPEGAFAKVATDVVVIGHAHAPKGRSVSQLDVSLQIGPLKKTLRVFGDRVWRKSVGLFADTWKMSAPAPFEKMPLVYERAYGGQDLTAKDAKHHVFEPRNLVGVGVVSAHSAKATEPAPNIEDPEHLIKHIGDKPPPAGIGFVAPNWQPRLGFVGTYDDAWQKNRMPLLAKDFNRQFFCAASPGLTAKGFLAGNEAVRIVNMTPEGRLDFVLPGGRPQAYIQMNGESEQALEVLLDTVIIDAETRQVQLLWRTVFPVFQRIYDIESLRLTLPEVANPAETKRESVFAVDSQGRMAWA